MSERPWGRPGPRELLVLLILCACVPLQVLPGLRGKVATSDEATHLASGAASLQTGLVNRLNPEHPPLVKLLSAAPLRWVRPRPVLPLEDRSWAGEPPDQTRFGRLYLYEGGAARHLFLARLPVVCLATLLVAAVWMSARRLFGPWGALWAAALAAFEPSLLAHGRLITTDVPLALFATLTAAGAAAWKERPTLARAALAGLGLGAALASKFSAVLLLPGLVIVALFPMRPARELLVRLGHVAWMAAIAVGVAWVCYGFPGDWLFYARGLLTVNANHIPGYRCYLLGHVYTGHHPLYFVVTTLAKTTVPMGILLLVAAGSLFTPSGRPRRGEGTHAVLAVLFFAGTTALADNLGHRYVLPAVALALPLAGRLGALLSGTGARAGVAALLLWHAGEAIVTHPDYIPYTNELFGGTARATSVYEDSNVDWGEDLARLGPWLRERGIGRAFLVYPWPAPPEYYGLGWMDRVPIPEFAGREPRPGEVWAVSAHALVRAHIRSHDAGMPSWKDRFTPSDRVGSMYLYTF